MSSFYQFLQRLIFQHPRILKYMLLSDCRQVSGRPRRLHPTLMKGEGRIIFAESVTMGVFKSPNFWEGYSFLESRNVTSSIKIGENTVLNNGFVAISAGASIEIGKSCVFGTNCTIFDSDFHRVGPNSNQIETRAVNIGDNVFVGSDVKILKGVTIGDHCVIAAGAIVTRSFPSYTLVGGSPAIVLKTL